MRDLVYLISVFLGEGVFEGEGEQIGSTRDPGDGVDFGTVRLRQPKRRVERVTLSSSTGGAAWEVTRRFIRGEVGRISGTGRRQVERVRITKD